MILPTCGSYFRDAWSFEYPTKKDDHYSHLPGFILSIFNQLCQCRQILITCYLNKTLCRSFIANITPLLSMILGPLPTGFQLCFTGLLFCHLNHHHSSNPIAANPSKDSQNSHLVVRRTLIVICFLSTSFMLIPPNISSCMYETHCNQVYLNRYTHLCGLFYFKVPQDWAGHMNHLAKQKMVSGRTITVCPWV